MRCLKVLVGIAIQQSHFIGVKVMEGSILWHGPIQLWSIKLRLVRSSDK